MSTSLAAIKLQEVIKALDAANANLGEITKLLHNEHPDVWMKASEAFADAVMASAHARTLQRRLQDIAAVKAMP